MIKYLLAVPLAPALEISRVLNIIRKMDHAEHVHGTVNGPSSQTPNFSLCLALCHSPSFYSTVLERSEFLAVLLTKICLVSTYRRFKGL